MKPNKHYYNKIIAPAIVVLLLSLYWLGVFAATVILAGTPFVFKLVGAAIPTGAVGVGIYVFLERIKEIESGEEDDISKY